MAFGGSQARGLIGAIAAGLRQGHNVFLELHLWDMEVPRLGV